MSRVLPLLFVAISVTGCGAVQYPAYYKNSNAMAIERGIEALDFQEPFSRLPKKSRVTLKNLERDKTDVRLDEPYYLDENTHYQIEQLIIEKLFAQGFIVLERDPQIVKSLLSEGPEVYRFSTRTGTIRDPESAKADEDSDGERAETQPVEVNVYTACGAEGCGEGQTKKKGEGTSENGELGFTRFDTPFAASDFIIAYRVLDCGVYIQELASDATQIERVVQVKLHLRISSSKTSEVIYAGRVETTNAERMDKEFYDEHEWIPYQDFDHTREDASPDGDFSLF